MEIPCLVLSGFLGSGKTTYLNSLLREANGLKLGILVNDFGDVPIDYDLIESAKENVLELSGGCVCCTYSGDLLSSVTQLLARPDRFDALVIETSGLSLPGIVAASVKLVPGIGGVAVLVLVDGRRIENQINDKYLSDTIIRQIQEADLALVTKMDISDRASETNIREFFARQFLSPDVTFSLSSRDVLQRLLDSDKFCDSPSRILSGSIFARPLRHLENDSVSVTSVTVIVSNICDVKQLIDRLKSLNLPLVRAKAILKAGDTSYAAISYAGTEWTITQRNEPPTKSGMTFFLLADAKELEFLKAEILGVFKAMSLD